MKNKKLDCLGKRISVAYIIRILYRQGISKVLRQFSNVNLKKSFCSLKMLFKVISNFMFYHLFDIQVFAKKLYYVKKKNENRYFTSTNLTWNCF